MDLELLKGHWNNWVCIIVVYLDEFCTFVPNITLPGEDAIDRSVKELSQPDEGISFSENQISQRALGATKNGLWIVKARLRSIYCGLLLFGRFCLTSVISWYLPNRLFSVADSIYQSYWRNFYGKCCAGINKFLEYSGTYRAIAYFDCVLIT